MRLLSSVGGAGSCLTNGDWRRLYAVEKEVSSWRILVHAALLHAQANTESAFLPEGKAHLPYNPLPAGVQRVDRWWSRVQPNLRG